MRIVLLLLIIGLGFVNNWQNTEVTLTIKNIKTIRGNIVIGVFDSKKTFLKKGKEFKTYTLKVTKNEESIVLTGLPDGDYAISIFHDVNSDNKCNTNIIGIPTEPYGFSNNFKPKLFKPSFNDCKIKRTDNGPITIKLLD